MEEIKSIPGMVLVTILLFLVLTIKDKRTLDATDLPSSRRMNKMDVQKAREFCVSRNKTQCFLHRKDTREIWALRLTPTNGNGTVSMELGGYTTGITLSEFSKNPGVTIIYPDNNRWEFYHQAFLRKMTVSYPQE